jgi:hypothetical protein
VTSPSPHTICLLLLLLTTKQLKIRGRGLSYVVTRRVKKIKLSDNYSGLTSKSVASIIYLIFTENVTTLYKLVPCSQEITLMLVVLQVAG